MVHFKPDRQPIPHCASRETVLVSQKVREWLVWVAPGQEHRWGLCNSISFFLGVNVFQAFLSNESSTETKKNMHLFSKRPGKVHKRHFFFQMQAMKMQMLWTVTWPLPTFLGATKPRQHLAALFLWAVSSERPERARPSWAEAGRVGMDSPASPTIDVNSSF